MTLDIRHGKKIIKIALTKSTLPVVEVTGPNPAPNWLCEIALADEPGTAVERRPCRIWIIGNMEPSITLLKEQLDGLMRYVLRVREEIAAIDRPHDTDHDFTSMSSQLEAIVEATDGATNTIMEAMENNETVLNVLREQITDPTQIALLDQITSNGSNVFEACSFQDITGQRINKVVRSVTYVEERVNAIIEIWGKDQMDAVDVPVYQEKSADDELVSGPQLEGQGLSQADIDSLFD